MPENVLNASRRWWLPSLSSLVFLFVAAIAAVFAGGHLLNADGELARHLTIGQYMVDSGHLLRAYPFTYTLPNQKFVPMEYGTQLLFAALYRIGGLTAVGVFCIAIIAMTHGLQARMLQRRGVRAWLTLATVSLSVVISAMFWQARPQIFTVLFTVVLLALLERLRPVRPWEGLLLFIVWANLHPGFIYGLALLGVYVAGALAESMLDREHREWWLARAKLLAQVFAASCFGTFLTPLGPYLHVHIVRMFRLTYQFEQIREFHSPDFHNPAWRPLLAGIILIVVALALSQRRMQVQYLLIIITHIQQTLHSNRYAALFGVTAITVTAVHLAPEWTKALREFTPGAMRVAERWYLTGSPIGWALGAAMLAMIAWTNTHPIGSRQLIPTSFAESRFPVRVVERARREHRAGRLYADNISWSSYVIFAWPNEKIFIDGSGDFFGDDILRESHLVRSGKAGYDAPLKKYDVGLVVAKRGSELVEALAENPEWHVADCDSVATLFTRSGPPESLNALGGPIEACLPHGVRDY